ncbi:MAG: prolyl-tRNA synthetase associated domain-containing protein [Pseudomonadota bacterium]
MTHHTEDTLLARLTDLGIAYTLHRHPPLFTVEDSKALRGDIPGAHCKNMFLKAKSGDLVLVTCRENRSIRIRDLEKLIGLRKLSFGKPDLLLEVLGVTPGAVTPLAVVNDAEARVHVILDQQLFAEPLLACHPLHNEATVAISTNDIRRILSTTGHAVTEVDFDALEEKAKEAAA